MDDAAEGRPPLHEISVSNLIFGQVWFIGLPLDARWQWSRGPSLPEVDATILRGGRRWVVSGRAWYALRDPDRGIACELSVDIRPGANDPRRSRWLRSLESAEGLIGGHRASIGRGTARRGLLHPITLTELRIEIPCDLTARTIRIDLLGNFSTQLADETLISLSQTRCH